jgi:hypothetical protein
VLPNSPRRRLFLIGSVAGAVLGLARALRAAVLTRIDPDTTALAALPAYVDTLLPPYLGPSATEIGVDRRLIEAARGRPKYLRLLRLGCGWLDEEARRRGAAAFAALNEDVRVAILEQAEAAAASALPRVFFEQTRADVFTEYYADPASWPAVGYDGPPQPRGFLDHARPPAPFDGA